MIARINDLLNFYEDCAGWDRPDTDAQRSPATILAELDNETFHPGMYRTFTIPKRSGGERQISAPNDELMRKQHLILNLIRAEEPKGSTAAHAYYVGRSIKTMAEAHVRKRWVIRLDLSDFFPNLSPYKVCDALRRQGMDPKLIRMIRKWCFLDGGLPQGAPTSPVLSNIATGFFLDRRLLGLCRTWRRDAKTNTAVMRYERINYTRYADDLCFSSDYRFLPKLIPALRSIITNAGFQLNDKKIRVMHRTGRQVICSVSLNQHVGKPRAWRMKLRGMIHRIIADIEHGRCALGYQLVSCETGTVTLPIPFSRIAGCVAHVEFLNKSQAHGLRQSLAKLLALHEDDYVGSTGRRSSGYPASGLTRQLSHHRNDTEADHVGAGHNSSCSVSGIGEYRHPATWHPTDDPWADGVDLRG